MYYLCSMEKKSQPKISIVTVVFNDRDGLSRTIDSVVAQQWSGKEYIVVDGGSTDGSRELIEERSDVIDRYVSEKDRGIYDAMNKGAAMATGDFVIFMNAGDTFAATDVISRVFAVDGAPEADIVYGDVVKGGVVKPAGEAVNSHRMFFCHQSCFARRAVLVEEPFDISHRMSADFKWVKTMIKQRRRFVKTDVAVAVFDTGGVSNRNRSAGLADNIKVVREMDSLLWQVRLLPRLIVPYIVCRLRGK